ncbi:MAG: HNH endonuclease, partial [Ilumatobacter sp.]|nr:HNH endonuclease [Ilumatobacter sp.]
HHLAKALGEQPAPLDPANPLHRCELPDGTPVDPRDALIAAAMGHVRRLVLDSKGAVVDLGRRQRLFTGPLREAVLLGAHVCVWPGCCLPADRCQADHVLPWGLAGPTVGWNGGPACGRHNRWRSRGYRAWRDDDGQWHHVRPDGSEIGWRGTALAAAHA